MIEHQMCTVGVKYCKYCNISGDLNHWYFYKSGQLVCKLLSKHRRANWYSKNKNKLLEYNNMWRKTNPEKHKNQRRVQENRLYKNNLQWKLKKRLRTRLTSAIRRGQKTGSAIKDLGCTIPELIAYLESKFQPGMAWDNYGQWHIDHIIPLSRFNLNTRKELLNACHYTNLQPLWAIENISKGNR